MIDNSDASIRAVLLQEVTLLDAITGDKLEGKDPRLTAVALIIVATQLNNILSHDNDQNMFVTMFIGCADLRTGHFDYCNCGHNIPLLDGKFMDVKNTNFPLGVMEGVSFVGESIDDIRDHQLLIYTDGLNEAENRQHELFGDDRLLDFISGKQDIAAEELIPMLHEVVERHRDGAIPNDDLTMLCLRVLKP